MTCEMSSGNCTNVCMPGHWSGPCTRNCSSTCLTDTGGDRVCDRENGQCQVGCESTWYGRQCTMTCSSNCAGRLCDRGGNCSTGCIANMYGPMCQYTCNKTCNDETCDSVSGKCSECDKPANQQTPLCRTAGECLNVHGFVVAWL